MPTYDYQCRSCGTITEVIHSMIEEGPRVCTRCGGELRRILYPAGIIFKGSGFYSTDSRGSGGKAGGEAAGEGAGPGASKKEKATDAGSTTGASGSDST